MFKNVLSIIYFILCIMLYCYLSAVYCFCNCDILLSHLLNFFKGIEYTHRELMKNYVSRPHC